MEASGAHLISLLTRDQAGDAGVTMGRNCIVEAGEREYSGQDTYLTQSQPRFAS